MPQEEPNLSSHSTRITNIDGLLAESRENRDEKLIFFSKSPSSNIFHIHIHIQEELQEPNNTSNMFYFNFNLHFYYIHLPC